MRGRPVRLSLPRRIVIDLLHFGLKTPTIPVQRQMSLTPLLAARASCKEPPRWTAIFVKAYALVAQEFVELRRAYIGGPWPHLYEYEMSRASVVIERDYQGEPCLFTLKIKDPIAHSLRSLSDLLNDANTSSIDSLKDFQTALRIARLPRPLRRILWWLVLNIGVSREHFFGTFMISVYSALNAESVHPISPSTTLLNYGVINSEGLVTVRIIYDHRVMNGATVARVLARLEEVLNGAIAEEIKALGKA
jgi:hypothetical protein